MDDADLKRRVKCLKDRLKNEYGITNYAQLLSAIQSTKPIDISIFVDAPPCRAELRDDVTETKFETA